MKRKVVKFQRLVKYRVNMGCGHFTYVDKPMKPGQMADCYSCEAEATFGKSASAWRWRPYEVR